jgi:hypothetical protein
MQRGADVTRVEPAPLTDARLFDPRALAILAVGVIAVTAAVAGVTAVGFGAQARGLLRFGFAGVTRQLGSAAQIFLNNAKLVALAGLAAFVAQVQLGAAAVKGLSLTPGTLAWLSRACGMGLLVAASVNVAIVGLAIGAYGSRMCIACLPHGPVELAAYCTAVDFYLAARRRPLSRTAWLAAGAATVGLLALAALLETYAWCG